MDDNTKHQIMITQSSRSYDLIVKAPTLEELEKVQIKTVSLKPVLKQGTLRFYPFHYHKLLEILERHGIPYHTTLTTTYQLSEPVEMRTKLREYQEVILKQWLASKRGVIALPTGAGKTVVGLAALSALQEKTIILVPTLTLLDQWEVALQEHLSIPQNSIGELSGNKKDLREITVSTYDSARTYIRVIKNHFGLIIADECHHATSKGNLQTLRGFTAPHRLGLTATIPTQLEGLIETIGDVIRTPSSTLKNLQKSGYLSPFSVKVIKIKLLPEEQHAYQKYRGIYISYLRKNKLFFSNARDFEEKLLFRVNKDPEAYQALIAHRKARKIAFAATQKIKVVGALLEKHREDQVIIFSEHNTTALEIAQKYLLPLIIHETPNQERKIYLKWFSQKKFHAIVTGRVLDEGWDVKNANIGIIVSGSAQQRQFIQRLGRLLRPEEGKRAILYELITEQTSEEKTSSRRKKTV